jgi:hypothetical protein
MTKHKSIRIPPELHYAVKLFCIQNDVKMTEWIQRIILKNIGVVESNKK